ncbi:tudor domain-containing protein 7A-like isoform X2 [Haemaphysalis longicornis]
MKNCRNEARRHSVQSWQLTRFTNWKCTDENWRRGFSSDEDSSASDSLDESSRSAAVYEDVFVLSVTSTDDVCLRFLRDDADCYFVDEGFTSTLDEEDLMRLADDFAALRMQAEPCQLDGLVQHAGSEAALEILKDVLLGKSLLAKRVGRWRVHPIPVVMFDRRGSELVDLNSEIFKRLTTNSLPEEGCACETSLLSVFGNGDISLSTSRPGWQEYFLLEWDLNKYCQKHPAMVEAPVMDKMYACREYGSAKFYHRAVLVSPEALPSGKFQIGLVDSGVMAEASLAEFRNIDGLSRAVRLPPQAVICRLRGLSAYEGVTITPAARDELWNQVKKSRLHVKVVKAACGVEPAVVELLKDEPTGERVSVNEAVVAFVRSSSQPQTPPAHCC